MSACFCLVSPRKWFCEFVAWQWHACCCSLGGSPWRCSLSHLINEIDQSAATEVVLQIRCMAMACMRLFLQVRPQVSNLKSQTLILRYHISNRKSQIARLKSQISNLKSAIADRKSQIARRTSEISNLISQIVHMGCSENYVFDRLFPPYSS